MKITNSFQIVDLHADLPFDVVKKRAVGEHHVLESHHLQKLKNGKVSALIAPIWVESSYKLNQALRRGLQIVDALIEDLKESPSFRFATNYNDLMENERNGKISLILGVEGGEIIEDQIGLLHNFWRFGVRCFGLVWNERNLLADGWDHATDDRGLTDFGKQVVESLNRLGVIIDLAHMAPKSFWDIVEVTTDPLIVSHTATPKSRALRNTNDDQLKAVADNGGIVGIFAVDNGGMPDLKTYCDHVEYAVRIAGPEHVGLGPDFVDYFMEDIKSDPRTSVRPVAGLEDHSKFGSVILELSHRGMTDEEVSMIARGNFVRIFKEVVG